MTTKPPAKPGDIFHFHYEMSQFDCDLVVTHVSGPNPEDFVHFSDGTHARQKHLVDVERNSGGRKKRIYLAASWRNPHYEPTLAALGEHHHVYDFKNGNAAFSWKTLLVGPKNFATPLSLGALLTGKTQYPVSAVEQALHTNEARAAWYADYSHLINADACVLLLPAGNSAHMEAGLAGGQKKPVLLYVPQEVQALEPDLMWRTWLPFIRTMPELLARLEAL